MWDKRREEIRKLLETKENYDFINKSYPISEKYSALTFFLDEIIFQEKEMIEQAKKEAIREFAKDFYDNVDSCIEELSMKIINKLLSERGINEN
jgi:hypothetical protein